MKGSRGRGPRQSKTKPRFTYFLETADQSITPEHPAWVRPLPLSRHSFLESYPAASDACLSVGDYFQAVRAFLEGAGWDAIRRALAEWGAEASSADTFRIFLAKHGEYYHPARVDAQIRGKPFHWVVNVAVSAAGRSLLLKEHAILERLHREFRAAYIPEVYGAGEVDAGGGRSVAMFLGQWFPGFHEFHLTRNAADAEPSLVLWDPENGCRPLTPGQARLIYHEAARILTHYFSLTTLEAIGAWHHAAGDFVASLSGTHPEVRLITVREYRPFVRARPKTGDPARSLQPLLETLLVFLLNIGIRTRLDRLDGTGDMAWSGPVAVEATVAGMLAALAEKPAPFESPISLDRLFRHYLSACAADDLLDLCRAIVAKTYPPGSPELALLEIRLKEHSATLAGVLSQL